MTDLRRKALASLPLTEATVQSFFDGLRSGTAEQCLKALCVSHERLRAELQGSEILLDEDRRKVSSALALTDTGSDGFKAAFPPRSAGESIDPKAVIPGWRVVEKIREVLL